MDMDIIRNAATELLVNITLGVISLAGAYGVYYIRLGASKLKAQTAQIADSASRKVLEDAVTDVTDLVELSVNAMEQTTAKELRDAVKIGAKDRGELLALGKKVFDDVKGSISPAVQEVISENLGSFDAYLTKCIEDAVLKVKQNDHFLTLPGNLADCTIIDDVEKSAQESWHYGAGE